MSLLSNLLGSASAERVLIFLLAREAGYAREIARYFKVGLDSVQKQLSKLETSGILYSEQMGKTLVYRFDPRFPLLNPLRNLLEKAIDLYPAGEREALLMNRRRPRRRGKAL